MDFSVDTEIAKRSVTIKDMLENLGIEEVRIIHVPIQGPLRTPKTPFQKGKMWLEIGASASPASKLNLPFGPGTTNLSSDLKLTDCNASNFSPKIT